MKDEIRPAIFDPEHYPTDGTAEGLTDAPCSPCDLSADVCRVIEHLAEKIRGLHSLKRGYVARNQPVAELCLPGDIALMNFMADYLNGCDAVDEKEDEWTYPIIRQANGAGPSAVPRQGDTSDAVAGSALAEAGRKL